MSKTIESLISEAKLKCEMWESISDDPVALADRDTTKEEAEEMVAYFIGVKQGLRLALSLLNEENVN